jgi:hypothetical protein
MCAALRVMCFDYLRLVSNVLMEVKALGVRCVLTAGQQTFTSFTLRTALIEYQDASICV